MAVTCIFTEIGSIKVPRTIPVVFIPMQNSRVRNRVNSVYTRDRTLMLSVCVDMVMLLVLQDHKLTFLMYSDL